MNESYIQLDEDYRLTSDIRQWKLQKKVTKKGVSLWISFKFFSNIEDCMIGYMEIAQRTREFNNFEELVLNTLEIKKSLKTALFPLRFER